MSILQAHSVGLSYGKTPIVRDFSRIFAAGSITAIIGPNGCGKSTVLRGLSRLLPLSSGNAVLDGKAIGRYSGREFARNLAALAQMPAVPPGMTVEELVALGRFPYRDVWGDSRSGDLSAIESALAITETLTIRHEPLDSLSGGQRQRAWIALVLAQEAPVLLLDEPTTYLDILHRQEILELIRRLANLGRTIVTVLHDVAEARQVSDRIIGIRAGNVLLDGSPDQVLDPESLSQLFATPWEVLENPAGGTPFLLPLGTCPAETLRHGPRALGSAAGKRDAEGTTGGAPSAAPTLRARPAPSAETEEAFAVRGVGGGYPGRRVLNSVSCGFPRGQISAIIGANASGKSTLLKTMAGLLPLASGSIELFGEDIRRLGVRGLARSAAFLPQGGPVPAGMTALEYAALNRYTREPWYRQWTSASRRALHEALELCDAAELRDRPVDELSGGQLQRVRIASVIAQESPVLLLDEPATFLDPAHQADILGLVARLNRDRGITAVLVLHELWQVSRYAHRVVAMKGGRVEAEGNTDQVLGESLLQKIYGIDTVRLADRSGNAIFVPRPLRKELFV